MNRIQSIVAAITFVVTGTGLAGQSAAPCTQWDVSGPWVLTQSNGPVVKVHVQQSNGVLSGTARYCKGCGQVVLPWQPFAAEYDGTVEGTITGGSLRFLIKWLGGTAGQYVGGVNAEDGALRGRTTDVADRNSRASWTGNRPAVCASVRPAPADQKVSQVPRIDAQIQPKPVRSLGKASWTATAKDDVDIYDGPGGEFTVVGVMTAGVSAPIVGQKDDWYQLKIAAVPGGSGWVAGDHLTTVLIRPRAR
jgi:hypothetical protein